MTYNWPPPPADDKGPSTSLVARVDTEQFPHALTFAAYLWTLANASGPPVAHGQPSENPTVPYIAQYSGVPTEVHYHGTAGAHGPASIPMAFDPPYAPEEISYQSTVIEYLHTTPEHFMSFAEVLSGQDVEVSENVGGPVGNYNATPVDLAYYYLAFSYPGENGGNESKKSPAEKVKDASENYAKIMEADLAADDLSADKWEGGGRDAYLSRVNGLQLYCLHLREAWRAELAASLVSYAALAQAARNQLDGIMREACIAMRRLDDEGQAPDNTAAWALLASFVGLLPLPYLAAVGVGVSGILLSFMEDKAKESATGEKERRIPADQSNSCVDILNWYLAEARATCENLADGVAKLAKDVPGALLRIAEDIDSDNKGWLAEYLPAELKAKLPPEVVAVLTQ